MGVKFLVPYLAVALLTTALVTGAAPSPARAAATGASIINSPVGSIDSVSFRRSGVRVVGWVATRTDTMARVHIVVDGRVARRVDASRRRFDVELALGNARSVGGFSVKLDVTVRNSICISTKVDGARLGLDCWYRAPSSFAAAVGGGPKYGSGGKVIRYSVQVEARTGLHPEDIAREVDRVLSDERGWTADGDRRFRRVRPGRAKLKIYLASPRTVDRLCAPFATVGRLSCTRGNRVILNVDRWMEAVPHWTADLEEYRSYVINHEVGHVLDFRHTSCPGRGRLAPIMQQQTKSLAGCKPNGWPNP